MRAPRSSLGALFLPFLAGCVGGLEPGRGQDAPDGGAEGASALPVQAWPADGTWGVPPELPLAILRFAPGLAGPLPEVGLEGPDGRRAPARVEERPCRELFFGDGRCATLEPERPLGSSERHHLVARHPAEGAWTSRFTTGSAEAPPGTSWLELACAIDERAAGPGCLLPSERRIVYRVRASGPVRLRLSAGGAVAHAAAPRGEATFALDGLSPGCEVPATLDRIDLARRRTTTRLSLHTTPPLAPLFITEVRADAAGPEPGQEYVEVINSGPVPLDLRGHSLSDDPQREGDVVTEPVQVPPGARVLWVSDRFDPEHPDDPTVPPGVLLVRLGTSLGSGGLSNSGEPVLLRDPEGRRLSAVPALAPPEEGACLVRRGPDGRTDDPAAFAFTRTDGCTPGLPDRLP